jgi:hypothetical protein
MLTAAQGRSYEHTLCAGRSLELSAIARLVWGKGWYGRRVHALPQLAVCLRDHGLEILQDLAAIADHQDDRHQEWCFAQGENRFAALYHYKSRDFAMGSAQAYRWDQWGYQETILHLRLGDRPEAAIWINHPGETIQFGYGRPSYWGGCGIVPRAQQYRGLAVLDFAAGDEQADFTHAWFPLAEFDEARVEDRRAVARSGSGAAVLIGSAPLAMATTGPSAGMELRQDGRRTRWIVRVAEAATASVALARYGALAVTEVADGTLVVADPDYGEVRFHADGTVEAEDRVLRPADFTVAGVATLL